jgi:hypothetical protein
MPLGAAELKLDLDGPGPPFNPGETIAVVLSLRDLGQFEAAGYQAFLSFDSSKLLFLEGTYLLETFALPIIPIIQAEGENIDAAAGINVFHGQSPTSQDTEVARLSFEAIEQLCLPPVRFRAATPPSQITDLMGMPTPVLDLIGLLPSADCNGNGVDDACDIADGTSFDINGNGVPDECECIGDIDGSGDVGVRDFLSMLAVWGPCAGCPADLDANGVVDVLDFLILIANWGPCP